MSTYFAYTRVSTAQQSQFGVSLAEQRDAIQKFAGARDLRILDWFEESESASRTGRKVFKDLVARLSRGEASGLIIHKVDRGARNLRDWADIGDLIDCGIDVRFVHDDLRLDSRGGRLAADIQAVIAADYIRNLRDEIRKGFIGRLKQGLYPLPAPFGYRNRGPSHAKVPDLRTAPIVQELFARYAGGDCSLRMLADDLRFRGITNQRRRAITPSSIDRILHNPFYAGTVLIRRSGQTFIGIHAPIIDRTLFDLVQTMLGQRHPKRRRRSSFPYSGFVHCKCGRVLVGELQKGRVYYRCHGCKGVCVRHDALEAQLLSQLPARSADSLLGITSYIKATISSVIFCDGRAACEAREKFDSRTVSR